MRAFGVVVAAAATLVVTAVAGGAAAAEERADYRLRPFVRALAAPVHVAAPPSERGRLYIVEQAGRIRVAVNGRLRA